MKIKEFDTVSSAEQKGCNQHMKVVETQKQAMKDLSNTDGGIQALKDFIFSGKDSTIDNPLRPTV